MLRNVLRVAKPEDYKEVERLCLEFLKETPYTAFDINEAKIKENLFAFLKADRKEKIVLLYGSIGLLIAQVVPSYFSDERIAGEIVFFVEKPYRVSRAALVLSAAFENWAKKVGCKLATHALMSTSPDSVRSFYKRKGYILREEAYVKELN